MREVRKVEKIIFHFSFVISYRDEVMIQAEYDKLPSYCHPVTTGWQPVVLPSAHQRMPMKNLK
jgi:hypothetical protein